VQYGKRECLRGFQSDQRRHDIHAPSKRGDAPPTASLYQFGIASKDAGVFFTNASEISVNGSINLG
jgi:hypothetical protein